MRSVVRKFTNQWKFERDSHCLNFHGKKLHVRFFLEWSDILDWTMGDVEIFIIFAKDFLVAFFLNYRRFWHINIWWLWRGLRGILGWLVTVGVLSKCIGTYWFPPGNHQLHHIHLKSSVAALSSLIYHPFKQPLTHETWKICMKTVNWWLMSRCCRWLTKRRCLRSTPIELFLQSMPSHLATATKTPSNEHGALDGWISVCLIHVWSFGWWVFERHCWEEILDRHGQCRKSFQSPR